jgi:pimeloyl-ACP methyl ester carboxylesterase
VITFDNRGIGGSGGSVPHSVEAMARDAVAFIRALGFDQVDLLGFSLGGFVAQVIAQEQPQLVRKIVLAGTGPAGGEGIGEVTSITIRKVIRARLTFKDPRHYLFFTKTPNGQAAARKFLKRRTERNDDRDKAISLNAFRAQLKAIHAWGRQEPSDLAAIRHPVLVANGDDDLMVPSSNSVDLARRLPNAQLKLYPDGDLNEYLRGFASYFRYGNSARSFGLLDEYAIERLALFLAKRHKKKRGYGYWRIARSPDRMGLIRITGTVVAPRPNRARAG